MHHERGVRTPPSEMHRNLYSGLPPESLVLAGPAATARAAPEKSAARVPGQGTVTSSRGGLDVASLERKSAPSVVGVGPSAKL